jgi:hypothetical protein
MNIYRIKTSTLVAAGLLLVGCAADKPDLAEQSFKDSFTKLPGYNHNLEISVESGTEPNNANDKNVGKRENVEINISDANNDYGRVEYDIVSPKELAQTPPSSLIMETAALEDTKAMQLFARLAELKWQSAAVKPALHSIGKKTAPDGSIVYSIDNTVMVTLDVWGKLDANTDTSSSPSFALDDSSPPQDWGTVAKFLTFVLKDRASNPTRDQSLKSLKGSDPRPR